MFASNRTYHKNFVAPLVDIPLAKIMNRYWRSFVKSLNPNSRGLPLWEPTDGNNWQVINSGEEIFSDVPIQSELQTLFTNHIGPLLEKFSNGFGFIPNIPFDDGMNDSVMEDYLNAVKELTDRIEENDGLWSEINFGNIKTYIQS